MPKLRERKVEMKEFVERVNQITSSNDAVKIIGFISFITKDGNMGYTAQHNFQDEDYVRVIESFGRNMSTTLGKERNLQIILDGKQIDLN